MECKKVSIVLPVYNGAEYVAQSIESVIAQTYQNWELIIVNDCSTDGTLEICNEFAQKDERIKVITNTNNLKLPNSLNVGFELATGDYFTWTSDDNMYRPEAIERLVNALIEDVELVMVYSDYTDIDSKGKDIGQEKLQDPEYLVTYNVCGPCFLYTAEIAKHVGGYDANLFLAEDYDYWIRIYRYGRIKHIGDDLYLYRRHNDSLSETRKSLIQQQTYKVLEKNFLTLYSDAQKHKMTYLFFNHMVKKSMECETETKNMLMAINKGYAIYLKIRQIKKTLKGIINGSIYNTY